MAALATSTLGSQLPRQAARAGDEKASATPAMAATREILRKTARADGFNLTDPAFPTGTTAT
jgi:hypothetical protein